MPAVEWNFYPSVVIGVIALGAAYLYAIGPFRRIIPDSQAVRPANSISFLLGLAIMFLALTSPLDALSDEYLFSAHMVQHTLLTLVVPPLLLAGTPGWLVEVIFRNSMIRRFFRVITNPLIAFSLYNLVFALWHLPTAYEAALDNEAIHVIEHLSFISSAVLFWWPILSTSTSIPALTYPRQILYLFLSSIPCTILGGVFVFAPKVIYPKYSSAPLLFSGLNPMTDQQIGGVIMAMAGMFIFLGFLGRSFYLWYNHSSKQEVPGT